MALQINKLSARAVDALTKAERHSDGGGLYLSITPARMDHARARMVRRQSPVRHSVRRKIHTGDDLNMFNRSGHARKS
jgi:hypothetical protein